MPAKANSRLLMAVLVTALVALGGCAGSVVKPPGVPDESALAPAEQALAKARAAQADDFAPRDVDAARRRIATARDILFDAARANRDLNDTERQRVERLADAAVLDARAALLKTQALAVQSKVEELQSQLGDSADSSTTQSEVSP